MYPSWLLQEANIPYSPIFFDSVSGILKKIKVNYGNNWISLVAQLVKNPPAMKETWVRSLGWEDPLEKGKATHSSILAWGIPWMV